jgi:hypothetical protein
MTKSDSKNVPKAWINNKMSSVVGVKGNAGQTNYAAQKQVL